MTDGEPSTVAERTEAVPASDAEAFAPAVDIPTEEMHARVLAVLLGQRETFVHDRRLLSCSGLVAVAREMGVPFEGETFDAEKVEAFVTACEDHFQRAYLVAGAFKFAVHGQLAIDKGQIPHHAEHEFDDPLQAYLGALEVLDNALDARAKEQPLPEGTARKFLERRWKADWLKACRAAAAVEKGAVIKVRDRETGREAVAQGKSDMTLHLVDINGKYVTSWSTLKAGTASLGDDAELQVRKIVRKTSGRAMTGLQDLIISFGNGRSAAPAEETSPQNTDPTFRATLFPESEYPDPSIIDRAEVERFVGVVPLPPDSQEIFFTIGFHGGDKPYELEIVTGEAWHTEGRTLVNSKGGQTPSIGIPSAVGGGRHEDFFAARGAETLGAKRAATAAEVGGIASTSIVLIAKPVVGEAKARVRRDVIRFKNGKVSADELAAVMVAHEGQADSLLELQNQGWLTADQSAEILIVITRKRQALLEERLAAESARSFERDDRYSGSGLLSFGGGYKGGALTRGGGSGGIGVGSFLHTGTSGVGTGREYGTLDKKFAIDPFASPKIMVLTPFGIQALDEADQDTAADKIANVVSIAR